MRQPEREPCHIETEDRICRGQWLAANGRKRGFRLGSRKHVLFKSFPLSPPAERGLARLQGDFYGEGSRPILLSLALSALQKKRRGNRMLGLQAAVAVVALFASAPLPETGMAGKIDPAEAYARNLAAVSEAMLLSKAGSPTNCLSARQHRRQPSIGARCTLRRPQPAGPQ